MADLPLAQLMDHLKRLKPFNAVLSRLLEVINTADASAADVTAVLSGDPALTGKVLELVNSSFYGLPKRVSTVSQAVLILGTRSIQNLAFSFACLDTFRGMGGALPANRFWDHSVATAVAAQVVAERLAHDPRGLYREMQTWPDARPEDLETFRRTLVSEEVSR